MRSQRYGQVADSELLDMIHGVIAGIASMDSR